MSDKPQPGQHRMTRAGRVSKPPSFKGVCLKVEIYQLGGLLLKASGLSKIGTSFESHVLVNLIVVVVTG